MTKKRNKVGEKTNFYLKRRKPITIEKLPSRPLLSVSHKKQCIILFNFTKIYESQVQRTRNIMPIFVGTEKSYSRYLITVKNDSKLGEVGGGCLREVAKYCGRIEMAIFVLLDVNIPSLRKSFNQFKCIYQMSQRIFDARLKAKISKKIFTF